MMTPQQRIEEIKSFFTNFEFDGFTTQDLLDLIDDIDKFKAVVSDQLQKSHTPS